MSSDGLKRFVMSRHTTTFVLQMVIHPRSSVLRSDIEVAVFKLFTQLRGSIASRAWLRRRWISSFECHWFVTDPHLADLMLRQLSVLTVPSSKTATSTSVYTFPWKGPLVPARIRLSPGADFDCLMDDLSTDDSVELILLEQDKDTGIFNNCICVYTRAPLDVESLAENGFIAEYIPIKPVQKWTPRNGLPEWPLGHDGQPRSTERHRAYRVQKRSHPDPSQADYPYAKLRAPDPPPARPTAAQGQIREHVRTPPQGAAPRPSPIPTRNPPIQSSQTAGPTSAGTALPVAGINSPAPAELADVPGVAVQQRSRPLRAPDRFPPNPNLAGAVRPHPGPAGNSPDSAADHARQTAQRSPRSNASSAASRLNVGPGPTHPGSLADAQRDMPPTRTTPLQTQDGTPSNVHATPMDVTPETRDSQIDAQNLADDPFTPVASSDEAGSASSDSSHASRGSSDHARRDRNKRKKIKQKEKKKAIQQPTMHQFFGASGATPAQTPLPHTPAPAIVLPADPSPIPPDPSVLNSHLLHSQPPAPASSPLGSSGPSHV
jgi:hypothetical protein